MDNAQVRKVLSPERLSGIQALTGATSIIKAT
jgi:hypothetical protein